MLPNVYALLAMLPCTYFAHYFVHRIVPIQRPVLYASLSTLIGGLIWAINHILAPQFSASFDLLIYLFDLILIFCFVPRKKLPMFFLIYVLLCAVQLISTILVVSGLSAVLDLPTVTLMSPDSMIYPMGCLMSTILAVSLMAVLIRLLHRILPPLRENRVLFTFACLFFCQLLLAYTTINLFVFGKQLQGAAICITIAFLLYIVAGVAFLRGYQAMHRMDLEALKSGQVEQQLELQTSYYQKLQENIIEVNQIRHDLSNQLQAAYYLLEQGEHDQVRQQLDLLDHQIRNRVGTKYCSNMIVDAILTEKARQCTELGIPLNLSVFLPEDLPIETAHLCSVFSNILDNSIQAVQATQKPYGAIELSADVHGSSVTIECTNPTKSARKAERHDLLRTHGLGLEILASLASRYHGFVNTKMEDGRFCLKMILELREEPSHSEAAPL